MTLLPLLIPVPFNRHVNYDVRWASNTESHIYNLNKFYFYLTIPSRDRESRTVMAALFHKMIELGFLSLNVLG